MTPERWRQIDDLFDAALRLDPAGREPWLREACGGDDDLRAEVGRLLAQDERADRDGFLTPPEAAGPPAGSDGDLAAPRRSPLPGASPGRPPPPGTHRWIDTGGFTPRQAIAPPTGPTPSPSPGPRAGAAARAADGLHPDPGRLGPLEARRPRAVRTRRSTASTSLVIAGPRGPRRPALEPVADPAGRAQGPGAGDGRPARRPLRLRPVPADARVLAARRR